MFVDARNLPEGQTLDAEVCILGAGAAGISMALAFRDQGFRVTVIESGGFELEENTQALYEGVIEGHAYNALDQTRLRYFGGSTNHWAGHCRPLDAIDFEARPWMSNSGWPFQLPELVPYYRKAEALCKLEPFPYPNGAWDGEPDQRPFPFDPKTVITSLYGNSRPTRFGSRYRADMAGAANVTCYLHLNVIELETDHAGRSVTGVRLATLDGKSFHASAKIFVLALGGIENVRLLLLSNTVQRAGLGNQHDLVGRYFMDHVIARSGKILPFGPPRQLPLDLYNVGRPKHGVLVLTEDAMRAHAMPNATVFVRRIAVPTTEAVLSLKTILRKFSNREWPDDLDEHVANVVWDIDDVVRAAYWRLSGQPRPLKKIGLDTRLETLPDPKNRIVLTGRKDRLGQNQVQLRWSLDSIKLADIRKLHQIIGLEAGKAGFGRIQIDLDAEAPVWPKQRLYGNHHIGTTRMHAEPRQGVVDAQCRVHGLSNLFIAGSSVFPTSGASNPTLTIVALALRLAERIKSVMG